MSWTAGEHRHARYEGNCQHCSRRILRGLSARVVELAQVVEVDAVGDMEAWPVLLVF